MAFERREYVGGAPATTLNANLASGTTTTFTVTSGTGYPTGSTGPFFVVVDRGLSSEEKIKCSSRSGNTLTIAASGRGVDNTSAVDHTSGAAVEHVLTAIDLDEANQHYASTSLDHHTQYLRTDGTRAATGVIQITDGTAGAPGFTFSADTDTGIYRSGANQVALTAGGSAGFVVTDTQTRARDGAAATPALAFINDVDTGIYRVGADQVGIAVGGVRKITVDGSYLRSEASNLLLNAYSAANLQSLSGGIAMANAGAVPTGNPTSGGFLYVQGGALKYWGSSGTVTTIAPA